MAESESLTALPIVEALRAVEAQMATLNVNLPAMTTRLDALNVNLAALQSADLQTILHDLAALLRLFFPKTGVQMAVVKLKNATGKSEADLQTGFVAAASAAGFTLNWALLLAWAEKWVPTLFWPVVMDVISGNWAALWALAASQGPQCVLELLAALGITLSPATP